MRKDITPLERERLLIAVQLEDAAESINTALRVRKAELILDYSDGITPRLLVSMPGCEPEGWLVADLRKRKCYGAWPAQPDLHALVRDLMERMNKHDAHFALAATKKPNQKPVAKLHVFFSGAIQTALTLFEVKRFEKKTQGHFLLPKELTR